MRLTRFTDYALRVLIYLGLAEGRLCPIREIAERYGISENHLMKVVQELSALGFVETVRGRRGGLRLAHAPQEIRIGEVVRRTEEDLELVECFGAGNLCRITPDCVLKGALAAALAAFLDVLDRYTLSDLIAPRDGLAQRLALAAPSLPGSGAATSPIPASPSR